MNMCIRPSIWNAVLCGAIFFSTSVFAEDAHTVQRAVSVSAAGFSSYVLPGDAAGTSLGSTALPTLLSGSSPCTVHSVTAVPGSSSTNGVVSSSFLVILDCMATGPTPIIK